MSSSSQDNSPTAVLNRFYDAERAYMTAGGKSGGASFDDFAATMSPDVVLHQSPDLPYGGGFVGPARYEDWAVQMSTIFSEVDIQEATFLEKGEKVVVLCTLVTKVRKTGEVMRRPMCQVVTVREGRIVDFRPFYWHVPDYCKAARGERVGK